MLYLGLVRCQNGHMFSGRRYGSICPYCNIDTSNQDDDGNVAGGVSLEEDLFKEEAQPVCGWIVCIEGVRKGKHFKIHAGKNFVGRADDMDIQILGDNNISRKNHAIIVYDSKKRESVLLPGDASGIAYLNGEAVYVPTTLTSYDVIELGKSKFLFVPFCGDHFEWE